MRRPALRGPTRPDRILDRHGQKPVAPSFARLVRQFRTHGYDRAQSGTAHELSHHALGIAPRKADHRHCPIGQRSQPVQRHACGTGKARALRHPRCGRVPTGYTIDGVVLLTGCTAIPAPYREPGAKGLSHRQRCVEMLREDMNLSAILPRGISECYCYGHCHRRIVVAFII